MQPATKLLHSHLKRQPGGALAAELSFLQHSHFRLIALVPGIGSSTGFVNMLWMNAYARNRGRIPISRTRRLIQSGRIAKSIGEN